MDATPLRFAPDDGSEPPYAPPRKPRGCFYYGCVASIVAAILGAILIGVVVFFTYRMLTDFVRDYGDDAPRPIVVAELPPEKLDEVRSRIDRFRADLAAGKVVEPLVLTAPEINALIDADPDLKGVIAVDLSGEKVRGDVSFPLASVGFPGKFLNGSATFDIRIDQGLLLVTFDTIEVKGKPIPEAMMAKLRMDNLAKDARRDPNSARAIDRIDRIEVRDATLVITPKPPAAKPEGDPDPPKAEP